MKTNPINGLSGQSRNPLDTCRCHTETISYGEDPFSGGEIVEELDIACSQCKNVYAHIAIQYVHPDDFHGIGDIMADLESDFELGAYQTQLSYHGPLLPGAHSIRQTQTREQIQQEYDDLPF